MAPSASKQKRLAEKAAKQSAKNKAGKDADASTSTSTPTGSINGSATNTPLTSMSAATSQEDLSAMAKLQIATDRCVRSCLVPREGNMRVLTRGCGDAGGCDVG